MKRYTDEEKRTILDELAISGLNRAAFCRERGLCYASVGAWAKARSGSPVPAGFVEVNVDRVSGQSGIEVWLPGAVCVRFGADTELSMLADFCRRVSGC